jgi:hypothetical protein
MSSKTERKLLLKTMKLFMKRFRLTLYGRNIEKKLEQIDKIIAKNVSLLYDIFVENGVDLSSCINIKEYLQKE